MQHLLVYVSCLFVITLLVRTLNNNPPPTHCSRVFQQKLDKIYTQTFRVVCDHRISTYITQQLNPPLTHCSRAFQQKLDKIATPTPFSEKAKQMMEFRRQVSDETLQHQHHQQQQQQQQQAEREYVVGKNKVWVSSLYSQLMKERLEN